MRSPLQQQTNTSSGAGVPCRAGTVGRSPFHAAGAIARSAARDESGSSLIELSVVFPVFFLLFFGLINFALVMLGTCSITYASRSAVRYASLHSSTSYAPASTQDCINIVTPLLLRYPSNVFNIYLSYSNGNFVGSTVTVSVDLTYRIVLPLYTYDGLRLHTSASALILQ